MAVLSTLYQVVLFSDIVILNTTLSNQNSTMWYCSILALPVFPAIFTRQDENLILNSCKNATRIHFTALLSFLHCFTYHTPQTPTLLYPHSCPIHQPSPSALHHPITSPSFTHLPHLHLSKRPPPPHPATIISPHLTHYLHLTHRSFAQGSPDGAHVRCGDPTLCNEALVCHVQVQHVEGVVDCLHLLHLDEPGPQVLGSGC